MQIIVLAMLASGVSLFVFLRIWRKAIDLPFYTNMIVGFKNNAAILINLQLPSGGKALAHRTLNPGEGGGAHMQNSQPCY